jgi:tRNA dimethylallyltransferase
MDKVICIVGPTGIGKTKLSIALAHKLKTEIINGDAIQIFKEGNILSAKPSFEERENITHYLLDVKELNEKLDIASFKIEASKLISDINRRGLIPIVVGGSGLYIKALIYDYQLEQINSKSIDIEKKYQQLDNQQLYDILLELDKQAAIILHPNNRKRVLRAIDICENNNITKTDFINKQKHTLVFDALVLGLYLDRDKLYDRINKRVEAMVNDGLVDEVKSLYERFKDNEYQLFQAIGYKELIPYFKKQMSLEECIEKIKQASRRYAKKQMTWLNNQLDVKWIDVHLDDFDKTIDYAIDNVNKWLNT